eukprot:TRINITY_DN9046_c0_g1_i1.p1 TRINITY_DN9046_c0_g1~~TRINITY_DN9046_c0_g1_i1.p1  ORF type:complete len:1029 (-),score=223.52 TRINITY_DN9046_c0_g1_i1:186-3272(-)
MVSGFRPKLPTRFKLIWDRRNRFATKIEPIDWRSFAEKKKFIDALAKDFSIAQQSDWSRVNNHVIIERGGRGLLRECGSLLEILQTVYPDEQWKPELLAQIASRGKFDEGRQKLLLESIGKQLGVKKLSDWTGITTTQVAQAGGKRLLNIFNGSLFKALKAFYPNHDWERAHFPTLQKHEKGYWTNVANRKNFISNLAHEINTEEKEVPAEGVRLKLPNNYWLDAANQKRFLLQFASDLNIQQNQDWGKITSAMLWKAGARGLLEFHENSLLQVLQANFPDQEWKPEWFLQEPAPSRAKFHSTDARREFVSSMEEQLMISDKTDWQRVSKREIEQRGGAALLKVYNGSLSKLMEDLYPEQAIDANIRFANSVQYRKWEDVHSQRKFLEDIEKELNFSDKRDWAKASSSAIIKRGGKRLLDKYNNSIYQLVKNVYSDIHWNPDDFVTPPLPGKWIDEKNRRKFFDDLAKEFDVKKKSDWAKVTRKDVYARGGAGLLRHYNSSVYQALQSIYPEMNWEGSKFKDFQDENVNLMSKGQQQIYDVLSELVDDLEINHKHPGLIHQISGRKMELDFYSPSLKLGIEYQGAQHFEKGRFGSLNKQQDRDAEKKKACQDAGITLIEVRFWWSGNPDELIATIKLARPDILSEYKFQDGNAKPIEVQPNEDAELAEVSFVQPEEWKPEIDPTGWWISNKYDGVRVHWDGSDFFTAKLRKLNAPSNFKSWIPPTALDGVLWAGENKKEECKNELASSSSSWSKLRFIVVDAPKFTGNFESRWKFLRTIISDHNEGPVSLAEIFRCESLEHLTEKALQNAQNGGNGLIIRKPQSFYPTSKEPSAVLKVQISDPEPAVVLQDIGQIILQNSVGKQFKAENFGKIIPGLRVGAVFSYRFFGLDTDGLPRSAVLDEVRTGQNWDDIQHFNLSFGDERGTPVCRNCKKRFQRDDLRTKVKGIYWNREQREASFIAFHFCPNLQCIRMGTKMDKFSSNVDYPEFRMSIGITSTTRARCESNPAHKEVVDALHQTVNLVAIPSL